MIVFKENKDISKNEVLKLYENAAWTSYTADLEKLLRAIKKSNLVVSAWQNHQLVGLIRTIGDDETICYIQDILVLEEYKRKGIGTQLLQKVLEKSQNIRQIVLLTDAQDSNVRKFYESQDFKSCDDGELVSFIKK